MLLSETRKTIEDQRVWAAFCELFMWLLLAASSMLTKPVSLSWAHGQTVFPGPPVSIKVMWLVLANEICATLLLSLLGRGKQEWVGFFYLQSPYCHQLVCVQGARDTTLGGAWFFEKLLKPCSHCWAAVNCFCCVKPLTQNPIGFCCVCSLFLGASLMGINSRYSKTH